MPPTPPETPPDAAVAAALRSLDRAVAEGAADRIALALARRQRDRQRRRVVLTASATVCAALGFFVFRPPAATPPDAVPLAAAHARVIAPTAQTLPDGSIVELRAGAAFTVEFSPTERRVILERGTAHFDVRRDPTRPFVVRAAGVDVRALGTAFSVEHGAQEVAVLVTAGRVAVTAPAAASDSSRAELTAGERTVVPLARQTGPALPIAAVSTAERARALDWRVPRLEFTGTPLAEAIPLFNRVAGTRFVVEPAAERLRLSGTLRADDADALLLLLRAEFGLSPAAQPDGSSLLRRR